jgi:mRNA-degrading endonuclease RelE of RelBE toxin-antitoxin system
MPARIVRESNSFTRLFSKLDKSTKFKLHKIMAKAVINPDVGKPMRFCRKGTRELYLPPFRLSYSYEKKESIITFLDLYHKDQQ